jgi:hypothetical protein
VTRRNLVSALAVACGASMVPGAQGAHGKHGALGAQESQIRITDVQAYYNRVGGNRGPVGDVEIIKQRLYNVRISQAPIGRADVTCMFLDRSERTCNATYFLPKGNLVVAGAIQSRLLYEIPIVGGTGLYESVRGTLTVTATHLKPRREVLLFRLSG